MRAEHAYLLVGAGSLTAAMVAYVLDAALPIELNRGAYAIMVALFVAGYCGWLSRSAERRMRRVAVDELRRMASALEDLREENARCGRCQVPVQRKPSKGQRHFAGVVGGQVRTVPVGPPLDAETEAALRRLQMKVLKPDADQG